MEQPEVKSTQNLRKLVMVNKRENSKTSKLILNHNALKFKINIEDAIKAQVLELKENSAEAKKLKAGARYECIYKNLLRDIR
jgi:arginine/ornithine N-succinyltransferase beta subunit